MSISLTRPLNQCDVFRIVNDFDYTHFKASESRVKTTLDDVIVITQLTRVLHSHLPIEIVDQIMQHHLKNSPSVSFLLMCYKNPLALSLPSPLAENTVWLNGASRFLLLEIKQIPQAGDCYQQLMISVFKLHFEILTLDQRIELIQRSNITPWEQKSPRQKLELLERIQAPTAWNQIKNKLQLISWKVQFFAARALENNIITWSMVAILGAFSLVSLALWLASFFPTAANSVMFKALESGLAVLTGRCRTLLANGWVAIRNYTFITIIAIIAISLFSILFGLTLRNPVFPNHTRKIGAGLMSVGENGFFYAFFLFFLLMSYLLERDPQKRFFQMSKDLQTLLLKSINQANITVGQERFIEAHLPELLVKWQVLISDRDTGS